MSSKTVSRVEPSSDNPNGTVLKLGYDLLVEQTKTIVEICQESDGRRIQITRKIRMRLVTEKVDPEIAERKKWKKYGAAAGNKPGPDLSSTVLGEPIFLILTSGQDIDREIINKSATTEAKVVICRYCQGAHWTARCPNKSLFAGAESMDIGEVAPSGPARYIAPSMRGRTEGSGSALGATELPSFNNAVRLSNLPDTTTEQDIRDLCTKIGPVARVHVAKDYVTGRCRGFGFVNFMTFTDAARTIEKLEGHKYGNLIMHAEWAKPATPSPNI